MVEPSDSQECIDYVKEAYELSEKFDTPVILRMSTRIAHSQSSVELCDRKSDTKKEYVIYTKNEKDENENITVYVSNVDRSSGDPKLMGVDDEEEWNRVKDVLRELSKSE